MCTSDVKGLNIGIPRFRENRDSFRNTLYADLSFQNHTSIRNSLCGIKCIKTSHFGYEKYSEFFSENRYYLQIPHTGSILDSTNITLWETKRTWNYSVAIRRIGICHL